MDELEDCTAKLAEDCKWYEKIALVFKPFKTHLSGDGFVLFKQIRHTLYIYAHGHFVLEGDGQRRHEDEQEYPYNN